MTDNTLTPQMLTGLSTDHLVVLSGAHRLQPQAAEAFQAMQQAAKVAGLIYNPPVLFAILAANWLFGMANFAVSGQY